MKTPSWTKLLAAGLAVAAVFLTVPAQALDIIGPTGGIYGSVADSSHYDGSYVAANLFDFNVTGFASGASITGGNEYARSGGGDCYVSFQLDMVYTNVGSIFYAQRNGSDPNADKVATISIWGDPATPFATSDPGRAPDSIVTITNKAGARFTEYLMTNTVAGQYFLLKLSQASAAGNPGGSELRLGASLGIPPVLTQSPTDKAVYAGGTARFSAVATGTAPLFYQWYLGASPLTSGGRIIGANTANLIITNVNSGDVGAYTVIVSNSTATATATANLSLAVALTNAAEVQTIAAGPRAFWQLNEASGSGIAFDYVGSFNGTYGGSSGSGSPGPQAPTYPGFAATNTALQTYSFTIDSAVTVPPMNISTTNSVTILAWIYQDGAAGPQQPYTGIVYCRGTAGQTSAGMICSGDGTQLAYQWAGNRYNFSSGLVIPTNQWTLVGIVYTPTATTLYCGSSNGIVLSSVDAFSNPGQAFEASMKIGVDTDAGESSRTFNGSIDDVAFFGRALSSTEISAIYDAGVGIVPNLLILKQSTNMTVFQGQPINLSVQVSGLNPHYQWYKTTSPIAGATNNAYAIAKAKVSDGANYYVVVTNGVNSVTSSVITVTVPTKVVLPWGASGAIYTNVSASSSYPDPNYVSANLFDSNLAGIALGTHLSGKDWADDGYGTSFAPAYVAFQVDQAYAVDAILYAQRNSQPGQTIDKITGIRLWASTTTPFSLSDPGTMPDAVISIPDTDAAILHAYLLPVTVTGQYFLIEVDQTPIVTGSNFGGNEFRLGTLVTPVPLSYTYSAAGLTLAWPAAATLQQADDLTGPWVNTTDVTNGTPVSPTAAKRFYRIQY